MQLLLDTQTMEETLTTTRRPGRPTTDNSAEIGRRYGMLVIQAIMPAKDSHGQRVLAVCDCGGLGGLKGCTGVIETRLHRLRTGETTSCGCRKVLRFSEFLVRQVNKLPEGMVAAIWEDHFAGQDRLEIAEDRDLKACVVDQAIRTHQRYLDTLLDNGTAGQIYLAAGEPGGLKAAATAQALPLVSTRYLVMTVSRRPVAAQPYAMSDLDWWAVGCEDFTNQVADRAQNFALGFKQSGEFTRKELRRSKGELLGTLAPDYLAAQRMLAGRLEIDQVKRLTPFVKLADATLSARQRRQKANAIRIMKQRRKDEAFDRRQQLNSELCQERKAA
jgi:hypothetical protein